MRILVVTNLFPPHHFGGYELLCQATVQWWRRQGHEVHVLTSEWRRSDVAASDGSDVSRALPIHWDDHRLVDASFRQALALERRSRSVTQEHIALTTPDVVSVWNPAALSVGLWRWVARAKLPVAAVVADDWLVFSPHQDPWARRFRGGFANRTVGAVVQRVTGVSTSLPDLGEAVMCFCSDHLRQRALTSSPWRIDRHPLVPAGIDTDRFPPGRERDRARWNGRLLYVGRLEERKGIRTLIRALPALPGARLQIVRGGETTDVPVVEALARKLGVADRVEMLGETPSHALPDIFAAADAVVFPSEWDEPFGMVPLEAMACGTPVIATGTGGSGEFLLDGVTAVQFTPGDPASLTAAIARLEADPSLRSTLVANGHLAAAWLSRSAFFEHITAWHLAAVNGFRGPLPHDRLMLPPELQADLPR